MGWMGVKCKLWVQQCSIHLFGLFYLVIVYNSKNEWVKVDGFAVILAHPDGKQFSNLMLLCVVKV